MANMNVPMFRGDGSALDPDPQLFFNQVASCMMMQEPEWTDEKQMSWFQLQLVPGSDAADWFEETKLANARHTASMTEIKAHFDAQWPPKPRSKKTVSDKLEAVLAYKLDEKKMLDMVDNAYVYENWAHQMRKLAKGISDPDGLHAGAVRDGLPPPLRKLVSEPTSFEDLASKVMGVRRKALKEAMEERQEVTKLNEELRQVRATARAAPETPTRGATAALAGLSFNRATQQPPLQSLLSAFTQAAQPNSRAPQAQAQAGGQSRGGYVFLTHSDADKELRLRDVRERRDDFQRTKLPRATTQAEYDAQTREFLRVHGNVLATEQRPCPLTIGTADAGTGECIDCGYGHRREEVCQGERLSYRERDYRRMAAYLHSRRNNAGAGENRGGATPTAAPAPSQTAVQQAATQLFLLWAAGMAAQSGNSGGGTDIGAGDVEQGNGSGTSA